MDRPHPMGVAWHPAWDAAERRLHALRVADRQRRFPAPRPSLLTRARAWIAECFG